MRNVRMAVLPLLLATGTAHVFTQAPAPPTPAGPTFDVVSIKRNTAVRPAIGGPVERPDGSFAMTRTTVVALINRAFPFSQTAPTERAGLPAWATTEYYDVNTTSSRSRPTPEDRAAMVRAMLVDRFKLVVHVEKVDQPVYDLVLARRDGKLGAGITPSDVDCAKIVEERAAAQRAAADAAAAARTPPPPPQRPDFGAPPPLCTIRTTGAVLRNQGGDGQSQLGDLLEGEATMDTLAEALRLGTGRFVVNKTGLRGSYRVMMNFDMMAGRRGPPTVALTPDAAPSAFTAVQEQLGLKLESSRAEGERLVIDRLERPTED
jgi:uncharacterized protein (TIGR03435 family)